MWDLLVAPFTVGYMQRALVEVLVLGVVGGVVGVHVVLRRLAFLTEVVQHTVFPGIAVAFAWGESLLAGALVTGVVSILLFTFGVRRRRIDPDSLMALLIATFFAFGVVVVSRRSGYQSDLTALLFGRILAVDQRELVDTIVVGTIALVVLFALHKELVMRAFDPLGSEALGYPPVVLDLVVNLVVMLTVIAAVRAVGTVLVVAFIVTPAAAARLLTARVGVMMAIAAAFAAVGGWLGLVISYDGSIRHGWRLASGATVVVVLTSGFVLVAAGRAVAGARAKARLVRGGAVVRNLVDSFQSPLFRRALVEAVLIGAIAGVVGVHVVLRRLPFFVVALSHATFPGVAIASVLGVSLFAGGTAYGLLVVVAVLVLGAGKALDDASVIGVVLAGSFAVGVLVLSAQPGSSRDLSAFLVGSILTVTPGDIVTTVVVGGAVLIGLALLHKELVLSAFDRGGASALGYRAQALDAFVLVAVTLTTVTAIPAVGTLLAVALLTVPALTARLWSDRVVPTMAIAAGIGALSGVLGLCASALWSIAAGGAIALATGVCFVVSLGATSLASARGRARAPLARPPAPSVTS